MSGLAKGCCSAVSPCNHQKRDPHTICETCRASATPADVGELVERLRERAETLNTGAFVSPDDMSTMGYYSRGSAELDVKVATALERVVRDRDEARADHEWMTANRNKWQDAATVARRRAESAESKLAEARKVIARYEAGLNTLATTFYKDDQHQDYAKHVLAVDRRFLEETR